MCVRGFEPPTPWSVAKCSIQAELHAPIKLATREGLEPSTSAVTGRRSNQLNHRAIWTFGDSNPGPTGYEPVALTNWAKGPHNDSDQIRTGVTAVKGRCLNRLTTEPKAPRVGLEPTTTRLTAECSTIELSRITKTNSKTNNNNQHI